jgi:hypothetical protein
MQKSSVNEVPVTLDKTLTRHILDFIPTQAPAIFGRESGQLVMDDSILERLLTGKSSTAGNFAARRLKFLFHKCSKGVREGRISIEWVNRLANFCLEIIPLIENAGIVLPTASELGILFDWYLDMQAQAHQEPAVVISTVCPDYPYDWVDSKAVFNNGVVSDDIGLVGESILETGPQMVDILAKTLNIRIDWIVGYAGFEGKPENLERMNLSSQEFRARLETSAHKMQQKLGVPVGILPEAVDLTLEQFNETRESFDKGDFNIRRKGMDALADAVDARDWACVFSMANNLNAIILDGASVYMGRKAYNKADQILASDNFTPRFFCVCNYLGFGG